MHNRMISLFVTVVVGLSLLAPVTTTVQASAADSPLSQPNVIANIPTVESSHPYANDENRFWTIDNNSGQNAARVYFRRIELEDGVDWLEIRDAHDALIQEIRTSAPDGLWSDPIPGAQVKVVLRSDGSGRAWGFLIDHLEPLDYPTLAYSHHPYPNNSTAETTLLNDTPNPAGTRVHFSRIEMEDGVDYIVIKDVNDVPYQWITGDHPDGLTSKAVPSAGIKIQLLSDGSGRRWGYNIDRLETAPAQAPDQAPERTVTLAESDHPYANNYSNTWVLTNPDVNAKSTKVHFQRVAIHWTDTLQVLDSSDTVVQTFTDSDRQDFWSDHVPGRVIKFRLRTSGSNNHWGFRVDDLATSVDKPGLAQSDHPYPNNHENTWTLANPDINAKSTKVHFQRVAIHWTDTLQVLDSSDTVVQTFTDLDHQDFWSDHVPGRVIKFRLRTSGSNNHWGFRVNDLATSVDKPGLVQSDHPYPNNYDNTWTLTNPDVNAKSTKVHFHRVAIHWTDTLEILDSNDTVVQTFSDLNRRNFWSDYVPGRIVKLRLRTSGSNSHWGFRVDDMHPSPNPITTPAKVTGVYLTLVQPGAIFLDNTQVAAAPGPGDYKVLLPTTGEHIIRIDYATSSQLIRVVTTEDGAFQISYLAPETSSASLRTIHNLASVSKVYLELARPATIHLNDTELLVADDAGEYLVDVSGQTNATIRLDYLDESQTLQVLTDDGTPDEDPDDEPDDGVIHLPLVTK